MKAIFSREKVFIELPAQANVQLGTIGFKEPPFPHGQFALPLSIKNDPPPSQITTIPGYQFVDTCYRSLLLSRLLQESSLKLIIIILLPSITSLSM